MAGYQPPQTIADLLNEQYGLAGELPPELDDNNRRNTKISLDTYVGEQAIDQNRPQRETEYTADDYYQMQSPVQRFNPQFTYKSVKDYASQLAMDLVKNGNGLSQNAMIGITSFVKLDTSLQNTTVLGNQLAEYSISEIQQFGLHVIDFKLMPAMQVKSNGDLTFSRNLLQLANNNVMNHVMSGTMIEKAEGVFVNARIISLSNNRVVSSASVLIPRFVAEQTKPRFVSYGAE